MEGLDNFAERGTRARAEARAERDEDNDQVMEEEADRPPAEDAGAAYVAAINAARRFAPPEDEATWTMPQDKTSYIPYIVNLMNFFHNPAVEYNKCCLFTRAQLIELNPTVIKRWLAKKAYGVEEYDPDENRPSLCRSSTLEQAKKCVSYFMPNKFQWRDRKGNPTRHADVSKVIADVKKAEARRLGVQPRAKRGLKEVEFRKTLEMFHNRNDWVHQYRYPTICLWQYNLIGRNDKICHFEANDPKRHPDFPFALQTKVRWSKNITEERECPDQILFGGKG